MAMPTLLDVAKHNNDDGVVGIIDETIRTHPELMQIPAEDIEGQSYDTLVRVDVPTGGFRGANEGRAAAKGTWENRHVQTFIADCSVECDQAVADTFHKGREVYLAREAAAVLEGQWRALCSQFYYGDDTSVATSIAANKEKGFPGLVEMYDSTNMEVTTGGSGSDLSSAWLIKFGEAWLHWVFGQNGRIVRGDIQQVRLTDGSDNPYDGYRLPMLGYIGCQMVNKKSIVRVKCIEPDNKLTDALLYQALDKFPAGVSPDIILMSRRSRRYLRDGRTATNATGQPAPNPTEFEGVPIFVTDAISDAESA